MIFGIFHFSSIIFKVLLECYKKRILEAFFVKKWAIFLFLIIFRRKHENINISCVIDLEMIEFYEKEKKKFLDCFPLFISNLRFSRNNRFISKTKHFRISCRY